MILDTPPTDDLSEPADVCIVGAGPAGITLALELAECGRRVRLLEAGGLDPDPVTQIRAMRPGIAPAASRVFGLGGTTSVWAGRCRPLDDADFGARPWIPDSGWPFAAGEMTPFYERSRRWLDLARSGDEAAEWERRAAAAFPLDPTVFRVGLMERRPIDFGLAHRERLRRSPLALVHLGAPVTRLVADRSGGSVESAVVRPADGGEVNVRAARFVLAAGGLETPRLLLASRGLGNGHDLVGRYFMDHPVLDAARVAIPRDSPLALLAARGDHDHAICVLADETIRREGLPNCAGYLEPRLPHTESPRFWSPGVVALRAAMAARRRRRRGGTAPLIRAAGRGWRDVTRVIAAKGRDAARPRREFRLRLMIESVPDRERRVVPIEGADRATRVVGATDVGGATEVGGATDVGGAPVDVRWTAGDLERRSARRFAELFGREVDRRGLGTFQPVPDGEVVLDAGKHHMGTTRMHDDPALGVVDRNCRVHGIDNLYVAGSAVFPTGGYANPTMTIVALAVRLGDYLRAE